MRNLLIQYKGGGYDGCFWEWNFAYYDDNKQFHDIHSSGRYGISDPDAMEARISQGYKKNYSGTQEFYLYPLSNPEKAREFVTESQEGLVLGVGKELSENHDIESHRFNGPQIERLRGAPAPAPGPARAPIPRYLSGSADFSVNIFLDFATGMRESSSMEHARFNLFIIPLGGFSLHSNACVFVSSGLSPRIL